MKLPRWLPATLLSTAVLATFLTAGWLWMTWPERTATSFIASIEAQNSEQFEAMVSPAVIDVLNRFRAVTRQEPVQQMTQYAAQAVRKKRRSLAEILRGRQVFTHPVDDSATEYFTVERGCVVDMGVILDKEYSALNPASY